MTNTERTENHYIYLLMTMLPVFLSIIFSVAFAVPTYLADRDASTQADTALEDISRDAARQLELPMATTKAESAKLRLSMTSIRLVISAIFGLVFGIVIDAALIRREVKNLVSPTSVLGDLKKDLIGSVSAHSNIFKEGFLRDAVYSIIDDSTLDKLKLDALSDVHRLMVEKWMAEKFQSFRMQVAAFARQVAHFDTEQGLLIDKQLVNSASQLVLASTRATEASMNFWTVSPGGREYRQASRFAVERIGKVKSQSGIESTPQTWGVFRVFTIPTDKNMPIPGDLLNRVIEEAFEQEKQGVNVKITLAGNVGVSIQDLDILFVDQCISSTTEQLNMGGSRRILVEWSSDQSKIYQNQWEMLWEQGHSPKNFCIRYNIPEPALLPENLR